MIALQWIRFLVGAAFLICGIIIFGIELFGVFKLKDALNRMHAAAMGDTLGIALSMIGLIILCGLNFTSVKLGLVVVFLWLASSVASRMLARFEVTANEKTKRGDKLLKAIIAFMFYSLIMLFLWILLEVPSLAIIAEVVGAGITSILFIVTLKKIHAIAEIEKDGDQEGNE